MANPISSISEDLKLFGNELLMHLQSALVFPSLVRTDYPGAATAPGSIVQVPNLDVIGGASTRMPEDPVSDSSLSSGYTNVTVKQIYQKVPVDNLNVTFSNVSLMEQVAKRLAYNVAAEANKQVADLWAYFPYQVGEIDGTGAFNATDDVDVLAEAIMVLSENKAPSEGLGAVISPREAFNIRKLDSYKKYQDAGTSEGLTTGRLKQIMGFNLYESQTVASATLSTAAQWGAAPLINKAGGYAIGETSIAVDALGAGSIKKGSSFKLGSYRYTVTADATITANAATLSIFPALKEAIADNAALTPTAHSAAGSMGMAFHRNAIVAVSRPLAPWGSNVESVVVTDPQTGLSIRVATSTDLNTFKHQIVADMLFGAGVVQPELGVRIAGQV